MGNENKHLKTLKPYKNCIVLLMGFAVSGKLTTATALAKYPNFRLVDNHTWHDLIFNIV